MKQPHELDLLRVLGPGPNGTTPPSETGVMTNKGWFSTADLHAVGAVARGDIIHFPVRYDPQGPFYAPLGIEGHAERLRIARQDAASEERRKLDRDVARGRTRPSARPRRWEDGNDSEAR